jgi:tripartite ATP-independent transporter DctM subunit
MEWLAFALMLLVFVALLSGYPVAFALAGVSLLFAGIGIITGSFDASFLSALPNRIFGIMMNQTLVAVPLFVFMGIMLERSGIAEKLLDTMAAMFGPLRGGLGISVTIVGMFLAASTGIVGATVVTMGLLSLPSMLQRGYNPALACGTICASGTLGQIIPPSIVLVMLGDVLSSAYQQAQIDKGIYSPDTVSVGDLFVGALIPGLLLVILYIIYLIAVAFMKPSAMPAIPADERCGFNRQLLFRMLKAMFPPLLLIVAVLGSILGGFATPTEAASVGAVGSLILAGLYRRIDLPLMQEVMRGTLKISCMVFLILIGAAFFSLVFRGFGGDIVVHEFLTQLPGGKIAAIMLVMLTLFLLGFVLDFIEITFIVVPIVGPILLAMDINPIWLGIMFAINLQTSFLTPPFGFALFYLRGVAPASISTMQIYRGVIPFIAIQIITLGMLAYWPSLVTWLPNAIYAN